MDDALRWRCDVTPELLDRAEAQLAGVLAARTDAAYASVRARRRLPERALRVAGLAVAALGILAAWAGIVLARPCTPAHVTIVSYASLPVFVVAATALGFWPRLVVELRAWARRVARRRAAKLVAQLRRRAPYGAEYVLDGAVLSAEVAWRPARLATDLHAVRAAIVAADLAGLFARRWPGALVRVVWLPEAGARCAFCDALGGAGVEVTGLAEAQHVERER